MLSREEISKFVYEKIEDLTHSQVAEWLINECIDNQMYQKQIKNQEQIIETKRKRIEQLKQKLLTHQQDKEMK